MRSGSSKLAQLGDSVEDCRYIQGWNGRVMRALAIKSAKVSFADAQADVESAC